MLQQVPRSWGELLAMLAALGAAIGTGKLLAVATKSEMTWRRVLRAAVEGAGLACGGIIPLFWFPNSDAAAVFGLGVLLAVLGIAGLKAILNSVWGRE